MKILTFQDIWSKNYSATVFRIHRLVELATRQRMCAVWCTHHLLSSSPLSSYLLERDVLLNPRVVVLIRMQKAFGKRLVDGRGFVMVFSSDHMGSLYTSILAALYIAHYNGTRDRHEGGSSFRQLRFRSSYEAEKVRHGLCAPIAVSQQRRQAPENNLGN
jgi:hypothetical protein